MKLKHISEKLPEFIAAGNKKLIPLTIHKAIATIFLILAILSPLCFRADPSFIVRSGSQNVVVSSHTLYNDCFIITLTGDADYDNIYAKKYGGALIYPKKIDRNSGVVIIPYDGEELNIYIPSLNGGCIQAVLSEHK